MFKTKIVPVVLYSCKTRSLTLTKECRLGVFENRILRCVFGPKSDENEDWRRFHNCELHSLYHSSNIVKEIKLRKLRWVGHVSRLEGCKSAFKVLTGQPTANRPSGRPRSLIDTRNFVDSAKDRDYWKYLVNVALNHRVP